MLLLLPVTISENPLMPLLLEAHPSQGGCPNGMSSLRFFHCFTVEGHIEVLENAGDERCIGKSLTIFLGQGHMKSHEITPITTSPSVNWAML